MIFIAKNEGGEPSWKLIQEGKKTVTRRVKPMKIGKDFAVCPGRGKFAICRCRVVSCMEHQQWMIKNARFVTEPNNAIKIFDNEAHKEGFGSWCALADWFKEKGIDINKTHRIEFKLI